MGGTGTGSVDYSWIFMFVMVLFMANSRKSDAAHRMLQRELPQVESGHSKFGRQCLDNPPTLNQSSGAGYVREIAGLKCYVSGHSHSERAVILGSDVYGYEAPNLRNLADKVGNAGFYVVVPDFFNGNPYDPNNTNLPLPVWRTLHDPVKAFQATIPLVKALKSYGKSAIGVAGFCYGGKVAVELAKRGLVEAGVLLHPSAVTTDDMKEVKIPQAILGAEFDRVACPPALVRQFKEILSQLKIDNFVRIFRNVRHGWTLRYQLGDKKAVKAAEKAHKYMLDWFVKYVK